MPPKTRARFADMALVFSGTMDLNRVKYTCRVCPCVLSNFSSKNLDVSLIVFGLFVTARPVIGDRTSAVGAQGRGQHYSCDDVTRHSDPVSALGGHRAAHGADADLHQRPRSVCETNRETK